MILCTHVNAMLGFFVYRCIFEVTKLLCYAKNSNSLQPRSFFHILTLIGTSHQYKAIYSSICAMHKFGKFSSLIQRMYDVDKIRSFIIMLYYGDVKVRKSYSNLKPSIYEIQCDIYTVSSEQKC